MFEILLELLCSKELKKFRFIKNQSFLFKLLWEKYIDNIYFKNKAKLLYNDKYKKTIEIWKKIEKTISKKLFLHYNLFRGKRL